METQIGLTTPSTLPKEDILHARINKKHTK